MTMLAIAAALSLLIGVVLGMLGGGGAVLTVPMLVYVLGLDAKTAIATSLFVVGATSVVGTLIHARAGAVRWRVGVTLGLAAMTGAYGGGQLAQLFPGGVLLVIFGVLMVVSAIAMFRGNEPRSSEQHALGLARTLGLGAGVGVVAGLVGAGGGFMIVPALTLFGGLTIGEAIATSLLVIALQSFAGFAGHVAHVELEWSLVMAITAASLAGSIAGAALSRRLSPVGLRRAFAWLVLAMGLFMFAKQLPALVAVAATAVSMLALCLVARRAIQGAKAS